MNQADVDKILRKDFAAFNQKCFEVLNPRTLFRDNLHLHAMAAKLSAAEAGLCPRLIITMPPRSLKSSTVSVAWVAYLLGLNPAARIVVVSYNETLAEKLSNDTRRIMESPFYRRIFPKTKLVKRSSLQLETEANGARFATSVGGSTTGFGGDFIILDDPHNAAEANSAAAREAVINYYKQALSSRLDDETTGRIVLVMQRLHADDLAGHLLRSDGWCQLKLQARATEEVRLDLGSGRTHDVKIGDLLQPERLPESVLQAKQRDMGSANFSAQYQQEPVPEQGNMIKAEWLQSYDAPPLREGGRVTLSVDTAMKTDPANDFSVCTIWLAKDGVHYLLDVWRDKVEFTGLVHKIRELVLLHRPEDILVEDHGSGISLVQVLRQENIPAIGRRARGSKDLRMVAATTFFEARTVKLPRDAHYLATFLGEILGYPSVRHDDQVDSMSQYFGWVREWPTIGEFSCDWLQDDRPTHEDISAIWLARRAC